MRCTKKKLISSQIALFRWCVSVEHLHWKYCFINVKIGKLYLKIAHLKEMNRIKLWSDDPHFHKPSGKNASPPPPNLNQRWYEIITRHRFSRFLMGQSEKERQKKKSVKAFFVANFFFSLVTVTWRGLTERWRLSCNDGAFLRYLRACYAMIENGERWAF